jgi:hypothetical protein
MSSYFERIAAVAAAMPSCLAERNETRSIAS